MSYCENKFAIAFYFWFNIKNKKNFEKNFIKLDFDYWGDNVMELVILIVVGSVISIIVNLFLLIFKTKSIYFKYILLSLLSLVVGSFIFMMIALQALPNG